MENYIGQQLGNYQLVRLLGEGGFAEVYLGEHIYLGTKAAIKVMHMSLAGEDMQSFRNEARIIANLIHPNIVRVLEFGIDNNNPYLVMDYAPNGTLRQRHPKGTAVPLIAIIPYVKQIAEALQCAHNENLVHRDVKPENTLLGRQNEVLLSDFGIALMAQQTREQALQTTAGTIGYIAPEQIQGKPRPASDQYSLGILVYEWLSGNRPFQGSFTEVVSQHLAVPPAPLREQAPSISVEVEQVVMKALAKNPKERFTNIRDFAEALEQASQGSEASILARRPLSVGQAAPVATPSISQTVLPVNTPSTPASSSITPARSSSAPSVGTTPTLYTYRDHQGKINAVAWSPNGRYFASASNDGTVIGWDSTSGNKLGVYRAHTGSVQAVSYSPSGNRVASAGSDRTVQVWEASTGNIFLTYRGHTHEINSVIWSPDEQNIASSALNEDIQVWDARRGNYSHLYRGHIYPVKSMAWSSDGQRIVSGGVGKAVQIWNATNGRHIFAYMGHSATVNAVTWSPDNKIIASGSDDKTVQIWDVVTGYNIFSARKHADVVTAVAWSPDGNTLASASADGTIQLWDTSNGRKKDSYRHSSPVRALAWSPDSLRLAFGSDDGLIQIWVVG